MSALHRDPYEKGAPVRARRPSNKVGRLVGFRPCQLACCGNKQIGTRWPNGRLTWPCTVGMLWDQWKKEWRIL